MTFNQMNYLYRMLLTIIQVTYISSPLSVLDTVRLQKTELSSLFLSKFFRFI